MKHSLEEWEKCGAGIREIRTKLMLYMHNQNTQSLLTKEELRQLEKALRHIEVFIDKADTKMHNQVRSDEWNGVFYGFGY